MIVRFVINDAATGTHYDTAKQGSISETQAFELLAAGGAQLPFHFVQTLLTFSEVKIADRKTGLILEIEND